MLPLSPLTKHLNYFDVTRDRITKAKGEGFSHKILIGFEAMDRFSFKVKIIRTKNWAIMIGIACISCVEIMSEKDFSLNSDHIAAYGGKG